MCLEREAAMPKAAARKQHQGTPIPIADYRAADELRTSLRRFLRSSEQIVRSHGLTEERYELLLAIKGARDGENAATVTALSDKLQIARSSATQLVRRAENLRLVRRDVAPNDARVHHLRLTDEGERRLAAAFVALRNDRLLLGQALRHIDANRQSATKPPRKHGQ